MRSRARRWLVTGVILTLVLLGVSASAGAATVSIWQASHGLTTRTIWDTTQVQIIEIPYGVNHLGTIHVELSFRPEWADLDLYLLDAQGNPLQQEMGVMAPVAGKEVIDHQVTEVRDTSLAVDDQGDPYMVGDTYYLVVVAFNEVADYQVWGYCPQIDVAIGSSPAYDWNYTLKQFRSPESAGEWATIKGPVYGYPYDFRPTSLGAGKCRLEWSAEVVDGTWRVTYDPESAPMPANLEQYLYAGARWDDVIRDYGEVANYLPASQACGRHGLSDTFTVSADGAARPMRLLHYVPSLYLAYADPLLGPGGPPKVGLTTLGFRATLVYPENLRLDRVVPRAASYALAGTLSLNGQRVPGAPIVIERKTRTRDWETVVTVVTDERGWWFVRLSPKSTWQVRARAAGDAATGLAREYSVTTLLKKL
jgi:hypothetical protein